MVIQIRRQTLISQHIEVALVYKDMLGIEEAHAYLERENISRSIAERVLVDGRRGSDTPIASMLDAAAPGQFAVCRRRNRLHDAIIEAALKIEKKMGRNWALALLRDEKVPDEVAARVLAEGPRRLRVRAQIS